MKTGLVFLLALVVLGAGPGLAQEVALTDPEVAAIQEQTLLPFLSALKKGDIPAMKKLISRGLLSKNRILLDENREYPAFLRNYYKDISFRVVKAEMDSSGDVMIFHVSFDSSAGSSGIYELKLSREKRGKTEKDAWVIGQF